MLTESEYQRERAICDRADAYWKANATYGRGGWSSLDAEKAKHPDYSACDNAMRGRVEQFEILRDLPETIVAYIGSNGEGVTTWTGDRLSTDLQVTSSWRVNSFIGSKMYQFRAAIGGREYRGRGFGSGMSIVLRETAESKRRNPR